MQEYQRKFIELALSKGVLKFGSFVLKSGRTSPYFFNAGGFNTGEDLSTLGSCYAHALVDAGIAFDTNTEMHTLVCIFFVLCTIMVIFVGYLKNT
ncbi:MAG: hypothetical protein SPL03_07520, partial [Succinivibrio dextrinosolvens]|nr:hypothetical protein [Succinivibrio dextrinosolvens]